MKVGRFTLLLPPAIIFWLASMRFFIMGMSVDDTTGEMLYIALGLTVANTIIQVVGNGFSKRELGDILFYGWIASYVLGVASNFYALTLILNIPIRVIEYAIAGSLSAMIEFMPEKMFVLFWRSTFPSGPWAIFSRLSRDKNHRGDESQTNNKKTHTSDNPASRKHADSPRRPKGMPRAEYQAMLEREYTAPRNHQTATPHFVGGNNGNDQDEYEEDFE